MAASHHCCQTSAWPALVLKVTVVGISTVHFLVTPKLVGGEKRTARYISVQAKQARYRGEEDNLVLSLQEAIFKRVVFCNSLVFSSVAVVPPF